MAKFCTKCGKALEDNVAFCTGCGAPVAAPAAPAAPAPVAPAPVAEAPAPVAEVAAPAAPASPAAEVPAYAPAAEAPAAEGGNNKIVDWILKNKMIVLGGAGGLVALIVVIVLLASLLGGGGYKKPIKTYFAWMNGKSITESKVKSMYPEEILDLMDDAGMDLDDLVEVLEDSSKENLDSLEDAYGDDVKISYKIKEADKMDKDDLSEYKDDLKDMYDIPKKDVKAAYEVEVEVTIKGDEDKDSNDMDLVVVKIGSKWCLMDALTMVD